VLGFVIAINLAYNDAFFKESTVGTKIAHFKNQVCSINHRARFVAR